MDFFRQTNAVVDVSAQTVDLLGGLTSVPMTATGEHELALAAIAAVIPPCSEVVLPARAKNNLIAGDYMLEDEMNAPCRRLMIARALVDPSKGTFACRLLNPTDTPIKLREGTPLGALVPVTPEAAIEGGQTGETAEGNEPTGRVAAVGAAPTIETMRKDLEAKGISLADTALQGVELDHLIRLLYENMDIMATSIAELPGTDIMRHRIETGDSPPIRKRAYRQSPQDMAEISRQTKEMLEAGIIQEADSPWSSPVLLVSKKDGTKRFCADFRALNSVTTLTSWPLPTIDDVIDTMAVQRPLLVSSLTSVPVTGKSS
jgi:hypothetical protein